MSKPTSPRGDFGAAPTTADAPVAASTGAARGQKRPLSFPEVNVERTINFSFDHVDSVSQMHVELNRIANAVGELNRHINTVDRDYLRAFGDL